MADGVLIAVIGSAVTLIGVIVSLIVSLNTARVAARKDMVQVLQTDNDNLRKENRELKIQMEAMEKEISELHDWIIELKGQILAMGAKPVSKRKETA